LVDGAHAPGAKGVHECKGPQDEPLGLALEKAIGLKLRENALTDQVLRQLRRLRTWVFLQKLTDHLLKLTAVEEIAASQIPHKPLTSSQVSCHHDCGVLIEKVSSANRLRAKHSSDGNGGDVAENEPHITIKTGFASGTSFLQR